MKAKILRAVSGASLIATGAQLRSPRTPRSMSSVKIVSMIATAAAVAGCAAIQPALDRMKSALPQPSTSGSSVGSNQGETRPAPSIDTTPLAGIFTDKPLDTNPYPRVAITVTHLPVKMVTRVEGVTAPTPLVVRGCWSMTAVLWADDKHSTAIPEFSVCPSDQKFSLPRALEWGNTPLLSRRGNTGSERTQGPLPPSQAMPHDPLLEAHRINLDDGLVIVLSKLNFDYATMDATRDDRRLWFVSFPEQQLR